MDRGVTVFKALLIAALLALVFIGLTSRPVSAAEPDTTYGSGCAFGCCT